MRLKESKDGEEHKAYRHISSYSNAKTNRLYLETDGCGQSLLWDEREVRKSQKKTHVAFSKSSLNYKVLGRIPEIVLR